MDKRFIVNVGIGAAMFTIVFVLAVVAFDEQNPRPKTATLVATRPAPVSTEKTCDLVRLAQTPQPTRTPIVSNWPTRAFLRATYVCTKSDGTIVEEPLGVGMVPYEGSLVRAQSLCPSELYGGAYRLVQDTCLATISVGPSGRATATPVK